MPRKNKSNRNLIGTFAAQTTRIREVASEILKALYEGTDPPTNGGTNSRTYKYAFTLLRFEGLARFDRTAGKMVITARGRERFEKLGPEIYPAA